MRPISICHIASGDLWAGAENQVYNIVVGLSRIKGCNVLAIVMNKGKLQDELMKSGIQVFLVDETKISAIQQLVRIAKIIKTHNVGIIHSHRYKENTFGALVKLFSGTKVLIKTQHGTFSIVKIESSLRWRIYRLIDLFFTRIAFNKVIGVSDEISKQFREYIDKGRIVTIHNSICPERYEVEKRTPTTSWAAETKVLKMAVIGRLVKIKNIQEFINITESLMRTGCNVISYVVGDGPEKEPLRKKAEFLCAKGVMEFLGFVKDISGIINQIDILFITSIHEGLPTVLLEAMYFEKIVIVKPVGGIPEVIEDNVNGFFYRDVNAAVSLVRRIHDNPSGCRDIGVNARMSVEREFITGVQAKKYMSVYKKCLQG